MSVLKDLLAALSAPVDDYEMPDTADFMPEAAAAIKAMNPSRPLDLWSIAAQVHEIAEKDPVISANVPHEVDTDFMNELLDEIFSNACLPGTNIVLSEQPHPE